MSHWIGCSVSIHCGDTLGTYQGQITEATDVTITLQKAFRNGLPYPRPEVTLNAGDIQNIQFIEIDSSKTAAPGRSTVTVAKPIAKRASRSVSLSETVSINKTATPPQSTTKSKPIDLPQPSCTGDSNDNDLQNQKKDKNRLRWKKGWRDEACFGTPLSDQSLQKDFDFEKNLALFNKQAIWEEINAAQKPDVVRQTDRRQQMKYRHDENVIATLPTVFREIEVSLPDIREYVTDAGLVVPSVTPELRKRLFAAAELHGFTWDRRSEMVGRAAAEMSLQLLGGGYRLNPHNTHQAPMVVALCGIHRHGALGLNALRQLASHGVNTVAYLHDSEVSGSLKQEYDIYKLTRNKITTKITELPAIVDLIILALCDDPDQSPAYPQLTDWINQNRAPVLALDPPAMGTPGVAIKFSLVPALPLSHCLDNGKLYLCNLGIPIKIFNDVGIKYKSPFGPKFVIPLHPNDT